MQRVSATLALIVAIIGMVAVLGAAIDRPWLLLEGASAGIHGAAALGLVLLSLALLAWHGVLSLPPAARRGLLVAAVGLTPLAFVGAGDRLAVIGAVCIALLSVAIVALDHGGQWVPAGDTLALAALLLASLVLYISAVDASAAGVALGGSTPLPVGALLMCTISAAVLLAAPDRGGLAALFASAGAGGTAARWFVPAALVVPIGLELARRQIERSTEFGTGDGAAATSEAFVVAVVLLTLVLIGSRHLDRVERELRRTREALFMSTLTHELRTPLVALRNLAQVVDEHWEDIDEELRRTAVRTAHEQSASLLRLVHDTTQLRRLEAGTLPARPTSITLRDCIESSSAAGNLEIEASCPPDLCVWADPEHLRLLLGACLRLGTRSGPGPITLHVSAEGDDACIHVQIPSRPDGAGPPEGDPAGWSLWTVAELARQWDGDASFERLDDDRGSSSTCRWRFGSGPNRGHRKGAWRMTVLPGPSLAHVRPGRSVRTPKE